VAGCLGLAKRGLCRVLCGPGNSPDIGAAESYEVATEQRQQ